MYILLILDIYIIEIIELYTYKYKEVILIKSYYKWIIMKIFLYYLLYISYILYLVFNKRYKGAIIYYIYKYWIYFFINSFLFIIIWYNS